MDPYIFLFIPGKHYTKGKRSQSVQEKQGAPQFMYSVPQDGIASTQRVMGGTREPRQAVGEHNLERFPQYRNPPPYAREEEMP